MMGHFDDIFESLRRAEAFGHRTMVDGAELFGHVPQVAPEAWFHIIYPPLSSHDIASLEQELELRIPPSYADWLKLSNGLSSFSDSLSLYGRRQGFSRSVENREPYDIRTPNLHERPSELAPSAIIVGGYSWDGSLLYLLKDAPEVYRCDRDSARPLTTWASLEEMLRSEFARLESLFDSRGRKRNPRSPTVP